MSNFPQTRVISIRLLSSVFTIGLLASCGGGGSDGIAEVSPIAQLKTDVITLGATEASRVSNIASTSDGSTVLLMTKSTTKQTPTVVGS
jgi:hypothetical protein